MNLANVSMLRLDIMSVFVTKSNKQYCFLLFSQEKQLDILNEYFLQNPKLIPHNVKKTDMAINVAKHLFSFRHSKEEHQG